MLKPALFEKQVLFEIAIVRAKRTRQRADIAFPLNVRRA
jgi:DNA-directed RNA polymerase subunit K/omega